MRDFNLEKIVNPCVVEKLEEIYSKDETYQKLLREEDSLYKKLSEKLTEEQSEELEKYFEATTTSSARKEILTYIQGMKDLLALLKALS